jgi:hypothetical protein
MGVDIDIAMEKLVLLNRLRESIPGRPNLSTLWRWRLRGVRGVKLEVVVVGGRVYSSREAVARFIAATTAAASRDSIAATGDAASRQPMPMRSLRQREKDHRDAETFLTKKGA